VNGYGEIGDAEALVTRNGRGIVDPKDLVGKKVAVTFATTTHYSLLAALKHWNIDPKQVNIVNMRPPDIAAAWRRGDIDAGYVWNPVLGAIKADGNVLVSSAQVAQWGSPTLDLWMVRKDVAAANPEFVQSFVDTTERAYTRFQKNHASWTVSSPEVLAIGRVTGATPDEVLELLRGNYYPQPAEESSSRFLDGGTVNAIADTAAFLKTQDVIPHILDDYSPYINASFVKNSKNSN
jgi:taurine transport system substrate-binding protein